MLNVNLLLVLTEERFHRVWLKHSMLVEQFALLSLLLVLECNLLTNSPMLYLLPERISFVSAIN